MYIEVKTRNISSYTMSQAVAVFEAKKSVRSFSFELENELPVSERQLSDPGRQLIEDRKKEDKKKEDNAGWRRYFESWEPDEE